MSRSRRVLAVSLSALAALPAVAVAANPKPGITLKGKAGADALIIKVDKKGKKGTVTICDSKPMSFTIKKGGKFSFEATIKGGSYKSIEGSGQFTSAKAAKGRVTSIACDGRERSWSAKG